MWPEPRSGAQSVARGASPGKSAFSAHKPQRGESAIRHHHSVRILGILRERGIKRPPRIFGGFGLNISKTGARLLLCVIDGTPTADYAWKTIWRALKNPVLAGHHAEGCGSPLGNGCSR